MYVNYLQSNFILPSILEIINQFYILLSYGRRDYLSPALECPCCNHGRPAKISGHAPTLNRVEPQLITLLTIGYTPSYRGRRHLIETAVGGCDDDDDPRQALIALGLSPPQYGKSTGYQF
jgi:hypothetical protein